MSESVDNEQKIALRAAQRAKIKQAYQKVYNNPFRFNSTIFDPGMFRYEAARAFAKDYFKYTPRSFIVPIGMLVAVVLGQMSINKERAARENAIQTGEKTYYERALWGSRALY